MSKSNWNYFTQLNLPPDPTFTPKPIPPDEPQARRARELTDLLHYAAGCLRHYLGSVGPDFLGSHVSLQLQQLILPIQTVACRMEAVLPLARAEYCRGLKQPTLLEVEPAKPDYLIEGPEEGVDLNQVSEDVGREERPDTV